MYSNVIVIAKLIRRRSQELLALFANLAPASFQLLGREHLDRKVALVTDEVILRIERGRFGARQKGKIRAGRKAACAGSELGPPGFHASLQLAARN